MRAKDIKALIARNDYYTVKVAGDKIYLTFGVEQKNSGLTITKSGEIIHLSEYMDTKTVQFSITELRQYARAAGCEIPGQLSFADCFPNWDNTDFSWTSNSVRNVIQNDLRRVYEVLSLFSGCGMLDYPFYKDSSFEIQLANDMNAAAMEAYRHNLPGVKTLVDSICNLVVDKEYDLCLGGVCCQPFSTLTRKDKAMENHKDYLLSFEYARVIREAKPKVFVVENVPGYLSKKNKVLLNEFIGMFPDYEFTASIVIDKEVGGYTNRHRAIIIASRIGKISLDVPKRTAYKTVREALAKVDATWHDFDTIVKSKPSTIERFKYIGNGQSFKDVPKWLVEEQGLKAERFPTNCYRLDPDAPAPCITELSKNLLLTPIRDGVENPHRCISIAEATALQGFDKEFWYGGRSTQKQQQIANGVPYYMGLFVKKIVKKALDKWSEANEVINNVIALR